MTLKISLFFTFSLIVSSLFSQNYKAMIYNLKNGETDSIIYSVDDSTKIAASTNFNIGNYNTGVNQLEISVPYENVWTNTNFTRKQKVSDLYNLENFPIRTSVKLFRMENDTLKQTCSGSIISGKHVLTAAHCVASLSKDSLRVDSMYVSPIYNDGEFNRILDCSWVEKIYTFKNRINGWEDIAILELEKPLGIKTGWIGLGYNNNDSTLSDGVFYKFSYPGVTYLMLDSNEYNGDTLYFSFGKINDFTESSIGVRNCVSGIPGESGSSLIKIDNSKLYTSYGVLSWSTNIRHSRINNATFHAIEKIIQPYLNPSDLIIPDDELFEIYPNPAQNFLSLESKIDIEITSCSLYNMMGYKLFDISINTMPHTINITNLHQGCYVLRLSAEDKIITLKFIKIE